MIEPGDIVVPRSPRRGRVIARDHRGGRDGVLVSWGPDTPPIWHPDPDGDLVVIDVADEVQVTVTYGARPGARRGLSTG